MTPVLNITKNCCRGILFQTLSSRSQVLGTHHQIPKLFLKSNISSTNAVMLNTTKHVETTHADHNHSKTWTAERFLAAGLLGVVPLSIAYPNPVLDYSVALALTAHVHWGFEAIAEDYARPQMVGAALSKAAMALVYALSVFTLGGLFYFNYSDVGLGQAIRLLWKL
ncbi:succinate dehydrogenase [ubiquinone] cytochrome b small subunit, mitochondrial-like [Uloborus diversus]|uniref:succinate dehydrogenase [ubiquinone] cytochrome b small subunit, mitochondrial-like n=1 Tax=Uloborus diversus TaxID=327109 RepID=UPI002409A6BB|nr:succinate dehydrogenase [ubiquinone] cytochrome b small subunit, mitochondrial-like [Uloborus diversus]